MIKRYLSWLRTDNRGVDPKTGQRYAPPFWMRPPKADPAEAYRAVADFPVWGPDISYWQQYINIQQFKDDGGTFVIIRNAHGLTEDSFWRRNADEAAKAGLWFSHYIYIEPATTTALKQANFFVSLLKQSGYQMPPCLDVEDRGGLSPDGLANYLKEFADIVEGETGRKPMFYTRQTFWDPYVAARTYWNDYYLWIARYVSVPDVPYPPYTPRDWPGADAWSLWQWTSTLSGYGSLDMNVYDGNLLSFLSEFNLAEDVGDEEPEDEIIYLSKGSYKADSGFEFILPNDEILRRLV